MSFILPVFSFSQTMSSTAVTQSLNSIKKACCLPDLTTESLEPIPAYELDVTGHSIPRTLLPTSIPRCLSHNSLSAQSKSHIPDDIYLSYLHLRANAIDPFLPLLLDARSILNKVHALWLLKSTCGYYFVLITVHR